MRAVLISGWQAEDRRLAADLEARGWQVLAAGRDFDMDPCDDASVVAAASGLAGPLDMLVVDLDVDPNETGGDILQGQDYGALAQAYMLHAVAPVRAIKAFLPHLEQGGEKRICVLTTAAGSVNLCYGTDDYLNHTTRAALHMGLNILFNDLRPRGYRMRLYCKDPAAPEASVARFAAEYFLRNRSLDGNSPKHSDEERLALRNWQGRELPW